jgi:hypothetical protein
MFEPASVEATRVPSSRHVIVLACALLPSALHPQASPAAGSDEERPCEWVTRAFGTLADDFPGPDLDELCDLADTCVDSQRLRREAAQAEREAVAAQRDLEALQRRAQRFEAFLGSEASARNREDAPSLSAHWRQVREEYTEAVAGARAAATAARARANAAGARADQAAAACASGQAGLTARLDELEARFADWEVQRIELARCELCETIEQLARTLQDLLARSRAARQTCAEQRLAQERDARAHAEDAAEAANARARELAMAVDGMRSECETLEDAAFERYEDCFAQALDGTDHVTGERKRGYGHRRTVRTGVRDAELGPVWFEGPSDAATFRRTLRDCLRNRRDGRTTRPNALTQRREARRCEARERRQRRRADRALEAAEAAARERGAARQRLEATRGILAEPFDRLEALLGRWLDLLRGVGEDCAFRREECDAIRRAGEKRAESPGCNLAAVGSRAQQAASAARRAGARMRRLALAGCAAGQEAVSRAKRSLDGLSAGGTGGNPGALDSARQALAERAAALDRARALLDDDRCEEAETAYARAARAVAAAGEACREADRLVARAESAAERAASLAESCAQREARLYEQDRRRREPEGSLPPPPPERAGRVPNELTPTLLLTLQDDGEHVLVEVFDVTAARPDADPEADTVPRGWLTVIPVGAGGVSATAGEVVPLEWDPLAGSLTAVISSGRGPLLVAAIVHVGTGDGRRTQFVPRRGMERFPSADTSADR